MAEEKKRVLLPHLEKGPEIMARLAITDPEAEDLMQQMFKAFFSLTKMMEGVEYHLNRDEPAEAMLLVHIIKGTMAADLKGEDGMKFLDDLEAAIGRKFKKDEEDERAQASSGS